MQNLITGEKCNFYEGAVLKLNVASFSLSLNCLDIRDSSKKKEKHIKALSFNYLADEKLIKIISQIITTSIISSTFFSNAVRLTQDQDECL